MSIEAWPIDEHQSDATIIRQAMGALIGSAGGTVGAGGLAVTQSVAPNMAVKIAGGTPAEGLLFIPGYTASTGPYAFYNKANFEQPIVASGATFARVDTIVARMYDNAVDSSGKHEPVFEALKGAEEAGVTLENLKGIAAVPKNCYVLAYVLVPAKAASIVTADIKYVAEPMVPYKVVNKYTVEKSYTKAEAEAGIEFSARQHAFVSAYLNGEGALTIGGVTLAPNRPPGPAYFIVPAGQKMKYTTGLGAEVLIL